MGQLLLIKTTGAEGVALDLARFEDAVSDGHGFLDHLADWIAGEEKRQFDTQGAAYPPKWKKLSPGYEVWKKRHFPGRKVLERTGLLKDSLTRRPFGIEVNTGSRLTVGTGVEYAIYHQLGTANMPARPPLIQLDQQFKRNVVKELQKWIVQRRR